MDSFEEYIDYVEPGAAVERDAGDARPLEQRSRDQTFSQSPIFGYEHFPSAEDFSAEYFGTFGLGPTFYPPDSLLSLSLSGSEGYTSDDMMRFVDYAAMEGSSDSLGSPPPSSDESSSSPEYSQVTSSPSLSPSPVPVMDLSLDYSELQSCIVGDVALMEAFSVIINKIATFEMPPNADFQPFVVTKRGKHFCAVEGCPWYEKGWKREDRGIAHVKKEHFRLLSYPCPASGCTNVYKWPHDLAKHRRLKHPQDGEAPPPRLSCSEPNCTLSFTKPFNLARHHRKVHKKPAGARRTARK